MTEIFDFPVSSRALTAVRNPRMTLILRLLSLLAGVTQLFVNSGVFLTFTMSSSTAPSVALL